MGSYAVRPYSVRPIEISSRHFPPLPNLIMANGPLRATVSQECINELLAFVTRHIEPDETPGEAAHSGYDWFYEYFSFIPDVQLRSQLAQAYYQSRYIHKLLVALKLEGQERIPFLLLQLLEYASLYEALTDYLIQTKYFDSEDFLGKRLKKEIKVRQELNPSKSMLIHHKDGAKEQVFFAYEKEIKLELRDIRFSARIGFVSSKISLSSHDAKYIEKIYDLRNHIHILKAAEKAFEPDHKDVAKAFKIFKRFVSAVKADLAA
jgi:hypothetical protein